MGLVSMVVALARPVRNEKVAQEHATVMLVVDVSASMEAVDVTPNRLAAAVSAAESFVAQVPAAFEIGLVSYDRAREGAAATPTTDRGELLASLASLTTGPGTATGASPFTAASSSELAQVYETIQQRIGHTERSQEILRIFRGFRRRGTAPRRTAQHVVGRPVPVSGERRAAQFVSCVRRDGAPGTVWAWISRVSAWISLTMTSASWLVS